MNLRKLKASFSGSVDVSNSFDVTKYAMVSVDIDFRDVYAAHLEGIWVRLTGISDAGVTKVTIKVTSDQEGDIIIIPDTEAEIARGLTTTNSGYGVFKVDLDYINGEAMYFFCKVNTGSAIISSIDLSYQREV
jgi:hypothetical protein